jgi:hypothetical protein
MRRMRPLVLCGAAFLGLALGTGAASAEDKTFDLKMSHWPTTIPLHKAIEEWGADVEKASGGTIKYKVFPSPQLGKAFDHYDMARDGIADFHLHQSRLSARPLPDHRSRRIAVSDRRCPWRHSRDRQLVPQICRQRDEGREVLLLVHP